MNCKFKSMRFSAAYRLPIVKIGLSIIVINLTMPDRLFLNDVGYKNNASSFRFEKDRNSAFSAKIGS